MGELKRSFAIGKREKTNNAAIDYIQMIHLLGSGKWDISGTLIEWGEERIADNCLQTPLKIQAMANLIQQVTDGRIVSHSPFPREGRKENLGSVGKMKYG